MKFIKKFFEDLKQAYKEEREREAIRRFKFDHNPKHFNYLNK